MIELEVYAAVVRDLNKILELDHQLEAVPGVRYKVDSNHDIVYLELDEPTITFREIRSLSSNSVWSPGSLARFRQNYARAQRPSS